MPRIYEVNLHPVTRGKGEKSHKIIIEAENIEQAVRDGLRFYEGRQLTDRIVAEQFPGEENEPYWGHYLGCMKVWPWAPQAIDETGNLTRGVLDIAGAGYFEWKADFPGEIDDWIVMKCRKD